MDRALTFEDISKFPIARYFTSFHLPPLYAVLLQPDCTTFHPKKWQEGLNILEKHIKRQDFLYMFIKMDIHMIHMLYFGKSTQEGIQRLQQHLDGLSSQIKSPDQKNILYYRMYSRLFQENLDLGIYLIIFPWQGELSLHNLFPFEIPLNLSNAEALLISRFSFLFPQATINHEFVSRTKWAEINLVIPETLKKILISISGSHSNELWNNWINSWALSPNYIPSEFLPNLVNNDKNNLHIPLFQTAADAKTVEIISKNNLSILRRHPQMEQNVRSAVSQVEQCYNAYQKSTGSPNSLFADGLIYLVYILRSDLEQFVNTTQSPLHKEILLTLPPDVEIIPIYIGKTEMLGRNRTYSANLKGVPAGKNMNYFARWGDDSARHIGGLSLRFFRIPNNYPSTDYEPWINIIFDPIARDAGIPKLLFPVYYRMKPWYPFNIAFADQVGLHTPELETFLIALGRQLFPGTLGNRHGR